MDVETHIYILYILLGFALISLLILCVFFSISPATSENRLLSVVKGVYPAVRVATTKDIDLNNVTFPVIIDDIQISNGDYVLVWKQVKEEDNGIYRLQERYIRAGSLSLSQQIVSGNDVYVFEGTEYGGMRFVLEAKSLTPKLGETALRFLPQNYQQFQQPSRNDMLITSDASTKTLTAWKDVSSILAADYQIIEGVGSITANGATGWVTRIGGVVQLFWQYPVRGAVANANIFLNPLDSPLRPSTALTANVWDSGSVSLGTDGMLRLTVAANLAPADPFGMFSYEVPIGNNP